MVLPQAGLLLSRLVLLRHPVVRIIVGVQQVDVLEWLGLSWLGRSLLTLFLLGLQAITDGGEVLGEVFGL